MKGGFDKVMQTLGRYYVQYFNYQYNRTGTLCEGCYKATVLDSEQYLSICSRYIELNPVRAGMVEYPAEYPWSSYHFNALGVVNSLLTKHSLYDTQRIDIYSNSMYLIELLNKFEWQRIKHGCWAMKDFSNRLKI